MRLDYRGWVSKYISRKSNIVNSKQSLACMQGRAGAGGDEEHEASPGTVALARDSAQLGFRRINIHELKLLKTFFFLLIPSE